MSEPRRVSFAPNIQQQLALRDLDAILETHSWGDQWYYQLVDGRILYVSEAVARQINMLDLAPGEPFVIVKRCGADHHQPVRWDVWRAGEAEKERAAEEESELERDLRRSIETSESRQRERQERLKETTPPPAPAPIPRKPTPPPLPPANPLAPAAAPSNVRRFQKRTPDDRQLELPWAEDLARQSESLVDVYASTLRHAHEKHGQLVEREDVRSLVITSYISQQKKRNGGRGGFHAA